MMKDSASETGRYPAAAWLGLLWVYSAAFFLLGTFSANDLGWTGGMVGALLRLLATVAVGVGLCAGERWGWGSAVALGSVYSVLAAGFAARATWIYAAPPPGTLSWMPLLWGLNLAGCGRAALFAWGAAALAAGNLWMLWRTQGQFDVPYRRSYSVVLRFGLGPALLIMLLDAYLLWGWWSVWTGR